MREKLEREYATKSNANLAEEMGISECAIVWKAKRMGLRKNRSWHCIDWTTERLEFLRRNIPSGGCVSWRRTWG